MFTIGEHVLLIDETDVLTYRKSIDDCIYDVKVFDKDLKFSIYCFCKNILSCCEEKLFENIKTDFKI